MNREEVIVEAPASVANFGPGYDVFAIALDCCSDTVVLRRKIGSGKIAVKTNSREVPGGKKNLAYHIIEYLMDKEGLSGYDVEAVIYKGIPVSAGLGGSGATSAAIAVGLTRLFELNYELKDLLTIAGVGEEFVSGKPHYDNVAASLLGGAVIVNPLVPRAHKLRIKKRFYLCILLPRKRMIEGKTGFARSKMPENMTLENHVVQSSLLAELVHALEVGDTNLLGDVLSRESINEKYRQDLVPGYKMLKEQALELGALGFNLCGAGPSVFIIHTRRLRVLSICRKLKRIWSRMNVESRGIITEPTYIGAKIMNGGKIF
jgi:homoserine kinase